MNYAYLGDRLSQSAAENFPVFLADLCSRRKDAYLTPSTRAILKIAEPGECEFAKLAGAPGVCNPSFALELVQPRPRRAVDSSNAWDRIPESEHETEDDTDSDDELDSERD